jgi:hypothetical protein
MDYRFDKIPALGWVYIQRYIELASISKYVGVGEGCEAVVVSEQ